MLTFREKSWCPGCLMEGLYICIKKKRKKKINETFQLSLRVVDFLSHSFSCSPRILYYFYFLLFRASSKCLSLIRENTYHSNHRTPRESVLALGHIVFFPLHHPLSNIFIYNAALQIISIISQNNLPLYTC